MNSTYLTFLNVAFHAAHNRKMTRIKGDFNHCYHHPDAIETANDEESDIEENDESCEFITTCQLYDSDTEEA